MSPRISIRHPLRFAQPAQPEFLKADNSFSPDTARPPAFIVFTSFTVMSLTHQIHLGVRGPAFAD